MDKNLAPSSYGVFLVALKKRIRETQVRAALSANREMILLYWSIGRDILTRQKEQGWGAQVIDRLAQDLHHAFPSIKGLCNSSLHKFPGAITAAFWTASKRRKNGPGTCGIHWLTDGAGICPCTRSNPDSNGARAAPSRTSEAPCRLLSLAWRTRPSITVSTLSGF